MRCASCDQNVQRKRLDETGWRCPSCGHAFVADPKKDGLSDRAIGKAVEAISAADTLYYSSSHLGYELLRRRAARAKRSSVLGCVVFCVIGVAVAFFMGSWIPVLAGFALATLTAWFYTGPVSDTFELARRYERVNPPQRHVPEFETLLARERGRNLAGLGGAKRMLVCERAADAGFFIANDFHLKQVCAVVGPDGQALDLYPGLDARLARGDAIDVFTLHDLTPAGLAFAQRVRSTPGWLGRRDAAAIIDLGLNPVHRPLVKSVMRPLAEISGRARGGTGWSGDLGAQITALRPAALLAAVRSSIEERGALRVPLKKDDSEISSEWDSE